MSDDTGELTDYYSDPTCAEPGPDGLDWALDEAPRPAALAPGEIIMAPTIPLAAGDDTLVPLLARGARAVGYKIFNRTNRGANPSNVTIYRAINRAADAGCWAIEPGAYLQEDGLVRELHLYASAAATVNAGAEGGIVVEFTVALEG